MKLPIDFLNSMKSALPGEYDDFIKSLNLPSPVSLRLNLKKKISQFDSNEKVTWAANAFYLPERISFTLDPLFHAGCYYVQEASSMYLEKVINQITSPDKPVRVLDLCAAPGGKSTHLLSILPEGSLLISNEVIPSRNKVLQHNISKWGYDNVIVTQNDVDDFGRLKGFFDIIIVDAPCSG